MSIINEQKAEQWRLEENARRAWRPWFGECGAMQGTCPNCAAKLHVFSDPPMRFCPACGGEFVGFFHVIPRGSK